MDKHTKFIIFAAVWAVLGIGSFLFFRRPMDPKIKRRWIVLMNILTSILFVMFMAWQFERFPLVILPFVALIAFLNIRNMKVCAKCSAVQLNRTNILNSAKFCSKCGAAISDTVS